jgi:hypothetical protein
VQTLFLDKFDVPCGWIRTWDREHDQMFGDVTWLRWVSVEGGEVMGWTEMRWRDRPFTRTLLMIEVEAGTL